MMADRPPDDRPPARIAIVEDHGLIGHSLAAAIRLELGAEVTLVDVNEQPDVLAVLREVAPTLALLDLDLGDLGPAVPFIGPLREAGIDVVVVTAETSPARRAECIEAGARTVLSKAMPFAELTATIERVLDGQDVLPRSERDALLAELRQARAHEHQRLAAFGRLTRREAVVLGHLMRGRSVKQIAQHESVAENTVRSQVRSVLQKLGVRSQTAAVSLAHRAGWRP